MAKRRMLSIEFFESDKFNDLPASAQMLYVHLILNSDDDGFLTNGKTVARMKATEQDFQELIDKGYIYYFQETSVTLVRDWKKHNSITQQKYHATECIYEKRQVILAEDKRYYLKSEMPNIYENDNESEVYEKYTQSSLGQSSLSQVSLGQSRSDKSRLGQVILTLLENRSNSKPTAKDLIAETERIFKVPVDKQAITTIFNKYDLETINKIYSKVLAQTEKQQITNISAYLLKSFEHVEPDKSDGDTQAIQKEQAPVIPINNNFVFPNNNAEIYKELENYLLRVTRSHFTLTEPNKKQLEDLINKGYGIDDFKALVDDLNDKNKQISITNDFKESNLKELIDLKEANDDLPF